MHVDIPPATSKRATRQVLNYSVTYKHKDMYE